ncbi:MAG: FAD-dependent oxidoreductase [Chloroflexi bacterium]|nr:FAD-dependent oxidoreductase [Chloroflexota bacterium]
MAKSQYERLFSPGRIGTLELKNRIVYPPMGTNVCVGGEATDRLLAYHEARAKGGVGLDIVENANIDTARGAGLPFGLNIDDDKYIPGLRKLAQTIKKNGAKAALQIYHGTIWIKPGQRAVFGSMLPKELSVEDIQSFIQRYVEAARRAKEAGFDAIEIHGSNINAQTQFRSAVWNKRKDKYGGSVEKRTRFMCDTIKAVRKEVGKDFTLWCRLSLVEVFFTGASKIAEYGVTFQDTLVQAPMFVEAGADAIHTSAFGFSDYTLQYLLLSPIEAHGKAPYLNMIEQVKKVVNVPVIGAAIITPEIGEQAIRQGKLDFVTMGRALQADPDLPNKLARGREKDIRPCIHCNHCIETLPWAEGVACVVNPALGMEKEFEIKKAAKPKKVIIVGGGPGGMEAARVATLRGHQVTLYEKERKLGGQLILAAIPPYKSGINDLTAYMINQLRKLKVKVVLGKAITAEEIKKAKPDVVILAAGVKPLIPSPEDIPELDTLKNVVTAEDVLAGKAKVGDKVFIIGGDLVGCETAEFLADQGKQVTIARRSQFMANKMNPDMRMLLVERLRNKGVRMLTGVQYQQAMDGGVRVHLRGGITSMAEIAADGLKSIPADTIVLAAGSTPNNELKEAIEKTGVKVKCVGDCVEPRTMLEAIKEGWLAASEI